MKNVGLMGLLSAPALVLLAMGCAKSVETAVVAPPASPEPVAAPAAAPVEEDPRLAGFNGKLAPSYEDSVEDWPSRAQAPDGAPNVLLILLDDTGFAHLGPYGGLTPTPNIDKLAAGGLTYTNFHTTALCSPTRAALMAGRNHHSIGLGSHALTAMGFPGYNGIVPPEAASGAKVLQQTGYTTYALGKWDHTPLWEVSSAGPFNGWPSEEGFDHYYGFMAADIHNFVPVMYEDHWAINPSVGKPNYHISTDMADRSIHWITAQKSAAPDRPFLMFWAPGAQHAPHHAPQAYLDKHKGKFDMGWDKAREEVLKRQIARGIFPRGTQLGERPADILAWDTLSAAQKKMYARQMEAFAAQLDHVDNEIGRMVDALERTGALENTIIMLTSDNGASGEGGLEGSHNEMLVLNGQAKTDPEENEKFYDKWGTAETDNHYHAGWAMAGNTPFRMFKQSSHNGGIKDPLIVHWPKGIKAKGELRTQYHHIIDVIPTVLDAAGVAAPAAVDGVKQMPHDGVSMKYSFNDAAAPTTHPVQYYEMYGNRALYDDGWKAVTLHGGRMPWVIGGTYDFEKDVWELYNLKEDPTESNNLAAAQPAKLAEMKQKWDAEAKKYNVYPLYDDLMARVTKATARMDTGQTSFTYFPPGAEFIAEAASPPVKNRNHSITASLESDGKTEGVIVACGGYFSGYSLYVKNNILTYSYNYLDQKYTQVKASVPLKAGKHEIKFVYEKVEQNQGKVTLFIDGAQVGQGLIEKTVPSKFSISEPFDVGIDNGGSVDRKAYTSPNKFSDKLDWVRFNIQ
jgi:arylsulfatase A-like enzyme